MTDGPPIETLMRRLAETPGEFLAEPRVGSRGTVRVDAVAFDVLSDLSGSIAPEDVVVFTTTDGRSHNWLRVVLTALWMVHDDSLRQLDATVVRDWLVDDLAELARWVQAEQFVGDQDRREELGRNLMSQVGLTPAGETESQAADRLSTVDSVARARILAETRAKRERAEELRREMEAQRAREAAARYSRE